MGATRANTRGGGKEKNTAQKNSTQTTAKSTTVSETPTNKKMQATPDQLRMAQMLSADGGSDKTVEIQAQVRQIMDVTSKSEEAILTALHDCNYNTEQAILALIDSADDSNEWQTISSKKSKSQQNMQSVKQSSDSPTDIKDGRPDKKERGDRGDRDDFKEGKSQREGRSSRGRGRVPPRMARGRGRENGAGRDNDDQSFGGDRDRGFSNDRGGFGNDRRYNDRSESGRGRGRRFDHMNGGGGRRGRGGTRSFTNSKFGTFEGDAFTGAKPGDNVWTNPPKTNNRTNASNFTASTWDSVPPKSKQTVTPANDDWGIDDWTGDLSKSQVFTPSTTAQSTFKEESSPPVYTPSMDSAVVSSTISAPGNQPPMTQSIDLATLLGKPPGSMSSSTASVGESIQPPPRPQPDVFTPFAEMKPPVHTSKPHDQMGVQQVVVQQQRPTPVPNQVKTTRKKLPPPSKIPASAVEMPGSNRGLGALDVQFGVMDMNNDQSSGFGIGLPIPPSSSVPTAAPPATLPVSGSMPPGITQKAGVFSVEHNSVSSSYAYPSQGTESSFSASSLSSTNAGKVHMPFGGFEQTSMAEKNSQNKIPNPVAIPLPNQNDLKANTYLSPQKPQNAGAIDTYSTNQQSQISRSTSSTLSSSGLSSTSGLHQSSTSYSTGAQSLGSRSGQSSYGNSEQSSGSTGALTNSRSSVKTDSYTGSGSVSTITGLGSNVMPSKGISPVSHNQGLSNSGPAGMSTSVPSSLTGTGSNAFGSSSLSSSSANSKITTSIGSASALGGLTNTSQSTSHSGLGSSSLNTGLSATNEITTSSASTHTSVQTSPMSSSKIGLDTRLDSGSHGSRGTSSLTSQPSLASASSLGVSPVTVSTSSLGYISTSASSLLSSTRTTQPSTTKTAPNIPPGMPILPNQYLMHNPLLVNAYAPQAYFNIDEMMMQSRMTMFPTQTAALAAGRDATTLGNTPYSVTEASKFGRTDASSPVATIATQQQTQQQGQTNHHQTQTAQQQPSFINPTVPPGYSYGGFPFYPAGLAGPVPGLQYTPAAMFPTMNANMIQATRSQSATTPHTGFQQHNTYGQHNSHTTFATGYDDLPGTQDFKTGYGGVSQTQSKNTVGRNSVVTSSSGPSDLTGSSYTNKTHAAFDSKSFHGTPPPFNISLAGAGQGGHINPPYAHTHSPFVPMMQQAHMLPHQMHSDGPGGTTQRSQTSATQGTKASYSNKGTYGWGS